MARNYDYSSADDDVRALLKKVTDAVMSDSDVEYFIESADNYIDARLYQLYQVPFTSTPPIINIISTHLAAFYALRTLYVQSRTTDNDAWMTSFKNYAMELMGDILAGRVVLLDSSGNKLTKRSSRGMKSSTIDYDPTFNNGKPEAWRVDENK
jgi:phage gp36-like protein